MLVGELLDLSELARTARGRMRDVLGTIDESGDEGVKGKVWLAHRLYEYHERCDTMQLRTSRLPTSLCLVTDASVQHPQGGVMARYVEGAASAERGAALRDTALRWRWGGGGGGGGGGDGEWRLQATDTSGCWCEATLGGAPVRPTDVQEVRQSSARQVRLTPGVAGDGAREPAEEAEPEEAARRLRETIERRLERLRAPPSARLDAAAFVSAQMRQLAALRARCTPRQWQLHEGAAQAPSLTRAQWLAAEGLRSGGAAAVAVTDETYALAIAIEEWWRRRPREATEHGEAAAAARGVCACVGGDGDGCGLWRDGLIDRTRYQECVRALDGRFEADTWRRRAGRRGDDAEGGDDGARDGGEAGGGVRDSAVFCLCGDRSATPLARAMHWETAGDDGLDHGLPPDERERVGVAWLLLDESTGRVLRAGCERLPATSESNDCSTKAEGAAVLEAIRDVLPELPVSVGLVEWTDSLGFKMQHDQLAGGHVKQRRRTRQPDTGTLYAVRREAGVRLERVEWQPADHNLPKYDERRWHVLCQANRAVDAGAGTAAEGGRGEELDYFATHAPSPQADDAYFSHGGAPITGDVRRRVHRAQRQGSRRGVGETGARRRGGCDGDSDGACVDEPVGAGGVATRAAGADAERP